MCHVSHIMCHVSYVTCHVSPVTYHMYFFFLQFNKKKLKKLHNKKILVKVLELVGRGYVINGAYPV